jgi:two-component system NtrC family sensor kinase
VALDLPAVEGRVPAAEPDTELSADVPAPARILIVEDEKALAELLQRALADDGHSATVAQGASRAWKLLSSQDFDLIVCDVRMPGMSGVDFHEKLIRERPGLAGRVLLVTGDVQSPEARRLLKRGSAPIAVRPLSLAEVKRRIYALLWETRP